MARLVAFMSNEGSPLKAIKTLPNEKCKCGSGKKAKKCCGTETKYFITGEAVKNRIKKQNEVVTR